MWSFLVNEQISLFFVFWRYPLQLPCLDFWDGLLSIVKFVAVSLLFPPPFLFLSSQLQK